MGIKRRSVLERNIINLHNDQENNKIYTLCEGDSYKEGLANQEGSAENKISYPRARNFDLSIHQ